MPFGLAMTTCVVKIFNAFVLVVGGAEEDSNVKLLR
jgi:hypothetical protein